MTAIHRRKMLGVMLGGAVVATAGLSMIPALPRYIVLPTGRVIGLRLCPAAFAAARCAGIEGAGAGFWLGPVL